MYYLVEIPQNPAFTFSQCTVGILAFLVILLAVVGLIVFILGVLAFLSGN